MDRYIVLEKEDLIIGIPRLIWIDVKLTGYDRNLAIILASCTIMLVMRVFIDEKLMKIVMKLMSFVLLPTIMLAVSQYYPKISLIDIRKLYLLVIINTIVEIFFNNCVKKIQSKIDFIMNPFYKRL